MTRFTVVPLDRSLEPIDLIAPDAGNAFTIVQRLQPSEADVFVDGVYDFTLRLAENGLWWIFTKQNRHGPEIAAFG